MIRQILKIALNTKASKPIKLLKVAMSTKFNPTRALAFIYTGVDRDGEFLPS